MSTQFGNRVKWAMDIAGLNQASLSKMIGIKQPSLSYIIHKAHGSKHNQAIAEACGVSAEWLATGNHGDSTQTVKQNTLHMEPGENFIKVMDLKEDVPLISWEQLSHLAEPGGKLDLNRGAMKMLPRTQGGIMTYAVKITSDSMSAAPGMEDTFHNGDIVYIDLGVKDPPTGKFIFAKTAKYPQGIFRQLCAEGGNHYLGALNPNFPPIFDEFEILGTAVMKLKNL